MTFTIRATVLQTPQHDRFEALSDVVVEVGDDGTIASITPGDEVIRPCDVDLGGGHVLIPGLIDTHIHAPQWPQLGTALDLPLERWLFEHTFPLEARYADVDFATAVWNDMVPRLLAMGTTTAVYYGSTHVPATTALARVCLEHGQRAYVGRVAMDHPVGTPEWYRDADPSSAVDASHRSLDEIRSLADPLGLVQPIITPRFIPACTDAALAGLAELAETSGAIVQTHCSESDWQHGHVIERFGRTDSETLESFGLLRGHTVLAHATHLTDADRSRVVSSGAGVAHCPLSNSYFAGAVFPARRNLHAGMRIGLGTDVAGGFEPSVLGVCGHAVTSSRMLDTGVDVRRVADRGVADSQIDVVAAFWMATTGGADLLGIATGLLEPGRTFDAIAIDTTVAAPFAEPGDWTTVFEQVVRSGARGAIERVWVAGNQVHDCSAGV